MWIKLQGNLGHEVILAIICHSLLLRRLRNLILIIVQYKTCGHKPIICVRELRTTTLARENRERRFLCALCRKSFGSALGGYHTISCKTKHGTGIVPRIQGNHPKEGLRQVDNAIYNKIVFCRKNVFMLPSGATGKAFVDEITWRCLEACDDNARNSATKTSTEISV